MPTGSTRQLLRLVLGTPDVPDRDRLARFVASRDEDAFAEIVRRHVGRTEDEPEQLPCGPGRHLVFP